MSAPKPIATGDLSTRPLEHLLLYVHDNRLDGTLVIWPESSDASGQDRLLFGRGQLRKAQLMSSNASVEGVRCLFARQRGVYAFYDVDVTTQATRVSIDMYALILSGLRDHPSKSMPAVLGRFGDASLRIRSGADLGRCNFSPEETAVLQMLRAAPASVSKLQSISGYPKAAARVLYLLALAKWVRPYDEQPSVRPVQPRARILSPQEQAVQDAMQSLRAARGRSQSSGRTRAPSSSGAHAVEGVPSIAPRRTGAPPPPPEQLDRSLAQTWKELSVLADRSEKQNLFEVLGLDQNATSEEIGAAYLPLIKKWHPDRLPAELADLRPWADRYFHRITQAHETLSNPQKRAVYVASMSGENSKEQEQVDRTLRAVMEFRKVEILIKRKRWDEASKLLDKVLELDTSDADYYVAQAIIFLHQAAGSDDQQNLKNAQASIAKALKLEKEHPDAWYHRGLVFERLGEEERATQSFRKVLGIKPQHLQASRKVRLADMRNRKNESSIQADLLGRLFGKKK